MNKHKETAVESLHNAAVTGHNIMRTNFAMS